MRPVQFELVARIRFILLVLAAAVISVSCGGGGGPPPAECVPQCEGRSCGSDGCGDVCGVCSDGLFCSLDGQCVDTFDPTNTPPDVEPIHLETKPVGSARGTFHVSDVGQAQYRVTLDLPPGRNGLVPRLALRYDSAAPNGFVGQGWTLEGYSVVTRCAQTIAQDSRARGVRNDDTDEYCLDGQRLVPVEGYVAGEDGAEYHPEREPGTKVISHRTAKAAAPDSWTVYRRDGSIDTFAAPALTEPFVPLRDVWQRTKTEDRNGNFIEYVSQLSTTYDQRHGPRTWHRPDWVRYNGHETALVPDTQVSFFYSTREDPKTSYANGWFYQNDRLLSRIDIRIGGTLVRRYQLTHGFARSERASAVLEKVEDCAPKSPLDPQWVCKPATRFFYDNTQTGLSAPELAGPNPPRGPAATRVGDIVLDANGDGRDDLLMAVPASGPGLPELTKRWQILWGGTVLQDTGVNMPLQPFPNPELANGQYDYPFKVIDIDGDGRDEILYEPWGCGKDIYRYLDWENGKFTPKDTGVMASCTNEFEHAGRTFALDLDGDGKSEWLRCRGPLDLDKKRFWTLVRPVVGASGSLSFVERRVDYNGSCHHVHMALDTDRDGQQELFVQHALSETDIEQLALGVRFLDTGADVDPQLPVRVELIKTKVPWPATPVDVNGDGLTDLVAHSPESEELETWVNTGAGVGSDVFRRVASQPLPIPGGPVLDVNGDGRGDILVGIDGNQNWSVLRSTAGVSPGLAGAFAGFVLEHHETDPTWPKIGERIITLDPDGNGIGDLMLAEFASESYSLHRSLTGSNPRLVAVTDGLGRHIEISYGNLTNADVYLGVRNASALSQCGVTLLCRQPRHAVVAEHRVLMGPNLAGTPARMFKHKYGDSFSGLNGRGWLGFGLRRKTEPERGIAAVPLTETTVYDNTFYDDSTRSYPFAGVPRFHAQQTQTGETTAEGAPIELINTTSRALVVRENAPATQTDPAQYFVYASHVLTGSTELVGGAVRASHGMDTDIEVDQFGNTTRTASQWTSGESEIIVSQYAHQVTPAFLSSWLVALPVEVSHTESSGGLIQTRQQAFAYDTNGRMESLLREPDNVPLRRETRFSRDVFGNVIETRQVTALATRVQTTKYEARAIFPLRSLDDEGYGTEMAFNHVAGYPIRTRLLGRAGSSPPLETLRLYDGFGRPRFARSADGVETVIEHEPDTNPYQPYRVRTRTEGRGTVTTWFDNLSRAARRQETAALDKTLQQVTRFDVLGRVAETMRPSTGSAPVTKYSYDGANRPTLVVLPDGTRRSTCYAGNTTCLRDARGYLHCSTTDQRGRLQSTYEAQPSDTDQSCDSVATALHKGLSSRRRVSFEHGPFGHLRKVTDADGNVTTIATDTGGRIVSRSDPDLGSSTYSYTAFDELFSSTDANGVTVFRARDNLGRILLRTEAGQAPTSYVWDDGPAAGLSSATTPQGTSVNFTYDGFGRLQRVARVVGGQTYATTITSRDLFQRPKTVEYPNRTAPTPVRTQHSYDQEGNVTEVVEGTSGIPLWRLEETNDFGQLTRETLGSVMRERSYDPEIGRVVSISAFVNPLIAQQQRAFEYDNSGNVRRSVDLVAGIDRTFAYDEEARLVHENRNGVPLAHDYFPSGNIKSKAGMGAYDYALSALPHAVTEIVSGTAQQLFKYDSKGQLTERLPGPLGELHVDYNSFQAPTRSWTTSLTQATEYDYDALQQRVRSRGPSRTVTRFPGLYYRIQEDGDDRETAMVPLPGGGTAEVVSIGGTRKVRLLLTDQVGSPEVVLAPDGTPLERRTFDPFGHKSVSFQSPAYEGTLLGFGGHEEAPELSGVHVGARNYDPRTGRFLSADPLVPSSDTQGLNRYSYAYNNPLAFTDPSGFVPLPVYACDILNAVCQLALEKLGALGAGLIGASLHSAPTTSSPNRPESPNFVEQPLRLTRGFGVATAGEPGLLFGDALTQDPNLIDLRDRGIRDLLKGLPVTRVGFPERGPLISPSSAASYIPFYGNLRVIYDPNASHAAKAIATVGLVGDFFVMGGAIIKGSGAIVRTAAGAEAASAARGIGVANAGPNAQYYIQDGVRRSLAAREAGLSDVPATIFRQGHKPITTRIPLDRLNSPKPSIPRDSRYLDRNLAPTLSGSEPPPISVEPLGQPGQLPTTPIPLLPFGG